MKCPHCLQGFHDNKKYIELGRDKYYQFHAAVRSCPECGQAIFSIIYNQNEILFYPKAISRSPLPAEVPKEFANDYVEACVTLSDSPKASAALSRRCLQHILRERGGVKPGNLANEIQQVIDSGQLPSYLLESLDAVRNIGNFAAHPQKSNSSGEVIPVEPGEAEWNLDVLESLFDFYFVQPELLRKKREQLNKKLQEAGKPEMK